MVILDNFPIWAVYVGLVIIMLAVAEAGFRVGIRLQDRSGNQGESKMTGAVVGGMAGSAIASDGNRPCQVATPYGGTFRSTYPAAYPQGSIPRTTDGLYGGPEVMGTHPQSAYPASAPRPAYPAYPEPAYPQQQSYPAQPTEECRTIWRETRLPDGRIERDPVTACRQGNDEWEVVDGYADDDYGDYGY